MDDDAGAEAAAEEDAADGPEAVCAELNACNNEMDTITSS